jgi:hypothetical protein
MLALSTNQAINQSHYVFSVPSIPRQLQILTIREEPPKIALTWLPPLSTYGNLINYTLIWGVQNGANRTEYISKTRLEWHSDFLGE